MLRAFSMGGSGGMNGYNFTERVRKVLAMSREESARLRHEYVGTEHILLGLLREGEGVAANVLDGLHAEPDKITQKLEETIKRGEPGQSRGPDLPYTSRAKKVLELAMAEARELNHAYVGTEHLLLGLLREEKGIAAQVLVHFGVTLDAARAETLRILGSPAMADRPVSRAASIAGMKLWGRTRRPRPGFDDPSGQMAASIIELLAQSEGVAAVFAAQGIDVAKLAAALRAISRSSGTEIPRADDQPEEERGEPGPGDSPPGP